MAKTTAEKDQRDKLRKIAKILLKESTQEILEAIDEYFSFIGNSEYETYLKKAITKAVDIAKSPEEAMNIFHLLRTGNYLRSEDEEELAFQKALSLCKFKQDVEIDVMGYFFNNAPDLNDENYFYAIFERGGELNSNPPKGKIWARGLGAYADMLLDITDKTCGKFGFKHGDRVIFCDDQEEVTIVGVGPAEQGMNPEPDVLWYKYGSSEEVCYSYPFEEAKMVLKK